MTDVLDRKKISGILGPLNEANRIFENERPGPRLNRQPVHTVYGGAQLFASDSAQKMGRVALRYIDAYAPDYIEFAHAFELAGFETLPRNGPEAELLLNTTPNRNENRAAWLASTVYERVVAKLKNEPVEDFRIDFEDGFGIRPKEEETHTAVKTAKEVAEGMRKETLPPFIGIRIKALNEINGERALDTLNQFVSTLLVHSHGKLPENFIVTLPKVTIPEQVAALSNILDSIEDRAGLERGIIGLELMIETPTSILDGTGGVALSGLINAARDRCTGVHFGVYDYTASLEITAEHQRMQHPACDFARHMMQVALAGTGIWLSDGATNILPVPVHRVKPGGTPLTAEQETENQAAVHRAWRIGFYDNMHSLKHGYYQGWDLHPGQLPTRYAAIYSFFLDALDVAALRLRTFVEKAAQATLVGDIFDDAATGQGLLNFFLRGINCGALSEDEVAETGLSIEEISSRSFVHILEQRANGGSSP